MNAGTLYGIGVGPGDPELLTVKAARVLSECRHIFVPKARIKNESVAANIAQRYFHPDARVEELVFPMTQDAQELSAKWDEAAEQVMRPLQQGLDVCFLTLGDAMLYSTYIYLLRALRGWLPELRAVTIPGITSMCAAAALGEFSIGEGEEPVTILPAADIEKIRHAAQLGGTLVLMKVGRHLPQILDVLEELGALDQALFVARAGQEGERIVHDLRSLRAAGPEAGYLSIILAKASRK